MNAQWGVFFMLIASALGFYAFTKFGAWALSKWDKPVVINDTRAKDRGSQWLK